jgi:hypothetical protein
MAGFSSALAKIGKSDFLVAAGLDARFEPGCFEG